MLTLKKRHRRRDRSLQSLAPGWTPLTPPTPTPDPVHVSSVRILDTDEQIARWSFDQPVQDPTGELSGLVVGGHRGWAWSRENASILRVEHHADLMSGEPWSNTAGAGGIRSTDGGELQAGSGILGPA